MTLQQPYMTPRGQPIVEGGYPQAGGEAPMFNHQVASAATDDVPATTPTNAWSNPTRALKHLFADEDLFLSAQLLTNTTDTTSWLRISNFGFTMPATATVVGIEADIHWTSVGLNATAEVHVSYGASAATLSATDNGGALPAADTLVTYGGEADLWGESAANLKTALNTGTDFGINVRVGTTEAGDQTIEIDYITTRIYYTITAAGEVRNVQQYAEVLSETDSDVRVTQHYVELLRSEAVSAAGVRFQRVVVVT